MADAVGGIGRGDSGGHHTVRVTLKGSSNETYTGTLVLRNLSSLFGGSLTFQGVNSPRENMSIEESRAGSPGYPEDPSGASYYVIAVVLVYGMSIVMLIASHIKRKHTKLVEDRQIHKYLQEFQIVKEKSSRDSYKSLKKSIMAKLNMHHKNPTYRTLSQAILPMMAVGLPHAKDRRLSKVEPPILQGRRASFQIGAFRPANQSWRRPRRASEFDLNWTTINTSMFQKPESRGSSESFASRSSQRSQRGPGRGGALPCTVEEDEPHSGSISTVVDLSECDDENSVSESLGKQRNPSPEERYTDRSPRTSQESHNYKPISVSKVCRVYEIPPSALTDTKIKPGGVHVALHKPYSTSKATISRLSVREVGKDHGNAHKTDYSKEPTKPQYSSNDKHLSPNDPMSHNMPVSPDHNEKIDHTHGNRSNVANLSSHGSLNEETNISKGLKGEIPLTNGKLCHGQSPSHNFSPGDTWSPTRRPLGSRRSCSAEFTALDMTRSPIDQPQNIKINVDKADKSKSRTPHQVPPPQPFGHSQEGINHLDLSMQNKRPRPKAPNTLDVPASVHYNPFRISSAISPTKTSQSPSLKEPINSISRSPMSYRPSSWSPPCHLWRHDEEGGPQTTPISATCDSDTSSPISPPIITEAVVECVHSYGYSDSDNESVSYCSNSSEDDVWLTQGSFPCGGTPLEYDDLCSRPPFPDLAIHGSGSSPLLTPKDYRRADLREPDQRISYRSASSRSDSPATSDNETLIHQITSV